MRWYRNGVLLLGLVIAALGLVLIGQGIVSGKPIGLLIGALFVAVGAGRIYLLRR